MRSRDDWRVARRGEDAWGYAATGPARIPTAFERRVYAVVRTIPAGEVRSYRWVAVKLGNPGLARAVGQALTRNPWMITVPCHRVIKSDGSLGGFAWGAAKKRRLLAQESV